MWEVRVDCVAYVVEDLLLDTRPEGTVSLHEGGHTGDSLPCWVAHTGRYSTTADAVSPSL